MNQEMIFAAAMGLVDPWYITKLDFKKGDNTLSIGVLDIYISLKKPQILFYAEFMTQ